MAKIELDKYYTSIEVANHCWEIVEKYVDFSTVKRIIEPSVGSGAFCNWKIKPNLMIDGSHQKNEFKKMSQIEKVQQGPESHHCELAEHQG